MTQFRLVGDHAETLESGAVVGVGEFVELSDKQPDKDTPSPLKANKELIDRGVLIEVPEVEEPEEQPDRAALLAEAKELEVEGSLSRMRNDELQTAINRKKEEGS